MAVQIAERWRAVLDHNLVPFRYRDFRLMWFGAFFSFVGTWVQSVAQGWYVYDLTNDPAKLAFVAFASQIPSALFGPIAGTFTDTLNRRLILVGSQSIYGINALLLAAAIATHRAEYWMFVAVALINGIVSTVEIPARQSIVSTVVPPVHIAAAVPINAMTFNLARLLGPSIGGILLAAYGAQLCYLINGISYLALIFGILAVRADLRATERSVQPIRDLLLEGMQYTWMDMRLRALFLMEAAVSMFALFYLSLMPAIARDMLGMDEKGLGAAMTAVGVGTMSGLITLLLISHKPYKAMICRICMTTMGLALVALSFARTPLLAFPMLALTGASGVMQFNTTNTLFQLIAPPKLKGRVIAMHVWALSGFGPLTVPAFGFIARHSGTSRALLTGGVLVLVGAGFSWLYRHGLDGVDDAVPERDPPP